MRVYPAYHPANNPQRDKKGLSEAHNFFGIKTLRELKNYIEKEGWIRSRAYRLGTFDRMGERSVKYFNDILKKYGIKPFGPLYKP